MDTDRTGLLVYLEEASSLRQECRHVSFSCLKPQKSLQSPRLSRQGLRGLGTPDDRNPENLDRSAGAGFVCMHMLLPVQSSAREWKAPLTVCSFVAGMSHVGLANWGTRTLWLVGCRSNCVA